MAPFKGPGREELIALLKSRKAEKKSPITLGHMEPQAVLEWTGSQWVLSALVLDEEKAAAEGKKRLAEGGMWMPEMQWAFLQKGAVLFAAASKEDLVRFIREMEWKYG